MMTGPSSTREHRKNKPRLGSTSLLRWLACRFRFSVASDRRHYTFYGPVPATLEVVSPLRASNGIGRWTDLSPNSKKTIPVS